MAERARPSDLYSEDEQQWRRLRAEQDKHQKKFYDDLDLFPNLFSLKSQLGDHEQIKALIYRQEEELNEGRLQYHLEKVRCHNLIIFCKFCLGRKQEALQDCEAVEIDTSKSIIFLTLKAMLQFEFGYHHECSTTMEVLQDMYKLPDFEYLLAVAESEKGYLLNCIEPRGFARAVDLFQNAIDACPNSDIYLWKYDLALVIRRNFSIYAHSEHSDFRPSELARRAYELLKDIVDNCHNDAYRGRAMLELARLVEHLKTFCSVCEENEGENIRSLCEDCDENISYEQVLDTKAGKEDFYILRECGRHFMYARDFERAVSCLETSYQKRENGLVCHILGKTYLSMYKARKWHFSSWILNEVQGVHQSPTETEDSATTTHIQGDRDLSTVLATETSRSRPPSATFSERRGSHERRTSPLYPEHSRTQERFSRGSHRTFYPPRGGRGSRPRRVDIPHGTRPVNTPLLLKSKLKDLSYEASDRRIKTAEYFYSKGCRLNPYNTSLLFDTGTLFEGMEDLEKALHYYQSVVALPNLHTGSGIVLVNAYERIGICLMKQLETCQQESERARIKARCEDMFMQSLIACRRAVVHLPQVSARRTQLWESYPRLLEILHQQEQGTALWQREARAHELVGEHLRAISVYQDVMRLATTDEDRIQAFLGTVSNYFSLGSTKDARYILDLFLTVEEERHWMLTNTDDHTIRLRETAVRIYRESGREALEARQIPDARRAFNTALLMKGRVLDRDLTPDVASLSQPHSPQNEAPNVQEQFDLSIFYDEEGQELLSDVAECVASSSRQFFGIRVSVNNEDGALGRLDFERELQVAESTHLVILVVDSTVELRPRMRYLANTAVLAHDANHVMLVSIDNSTQLPDLVKGLPSFQSDIRALLTLRDGGINESSICGLFDFLLGE